MIPKPDITQDTSRPLFGIWIKGGEWESDDKQRFGTVYSCSECKKEVNVPYMQCCPLDFCPNCGQKMRVPTSEERNDCCPVCGEISPEIIYTTRGLCHVFGCNKCVSDIDFDIWRMIEDNRS